MLDEKILIKQIVLGSKQAFDSLYSTYSTRVFNIALSYSKNQVDAEEITQDVFLRVFKNAKSFKFDCSLNTWIYRITVNSAINYLKKIDRYRFFKTNYKKSKSIEFSHPGVLLENKENSDTLFKVIDCLPNNQKTSFILSYIECLPRQEVADIMEISLKAVESLLQRAKKNLRLELVKLYPNQRKLKK